MKKFIFVFFVLISVVSCIEYSMETAERRDMISKDFWGTWIQMDTGEEYYIDSVNMWKCSGSNKKATKMSYGISGFALDYNSSDIMLGRNSKIYFRKGGSSRSFYATLSGFSESSINGANLSMRGGKTKPPNGGYNDVLSVSYTNDNNVSNSGSGEVASSGGSYETVGGIGGSGEEESGENTADDTQKLSFEGAVADDELKVSVEGEGVAEGDFTVTPAYDGENIGTIPVVPKDMYGFKTTYTIDSDAQGYLFRNKKYTLKLDINNIGDVDCRAFEYEVYCKDSNFIFEATSKSKKSDVHSTLEPGDSMTLTYDVRYSPSVDSADSNVYFDVKVNIDITDPRTDYVWKDSVVLRFYSGTVNVNIKAASVGGKSTELKGFFIYPDGRSKKFSLSTSSSTDTVLQIPWSDKDYILVFSGATADREAKYSFSVGGVKTADLTDFTGKEIIADEPNDSFGQALPVNVTDSVKAYLEKNDIDFYRINVGSLSAN